MTAREKIITSLRKNKPLDNALPIIPDFREFSGDYYTTFIKMATACGSHVVEMPPNPQSWFKENFSHAQHIFSSSDLFPGNVSKESIRKPADLKSVDVSILSTVLGVAENGAIWLSEKDCVFRILPFISQHLIVILSRSNIVENMHLAYRKIRVDDTGFGVFIGGPSKTADIEQSLVVGAQGTRSHTIILDT